MKKINSAAVFILAISLLSACNFNEAVKSEGTGCSLIPAKIIRTDCELVIFQLLTDELIGDAKWEDVLTGKTYSNVVYSNNHCKLSMLKIGEDKTLYIDLKKSEDQLDCVQCLAVSQSPPNTHINYASILDTPCDAILNKTDK